MKGILNIERFAGDLLFIDEPERYPAELWSDLMEAVLAYIEVEDQYIVQSVYQRRNPRIENSTRRQLARIFDDVRTSPLYDEMLEILDVVDSGGFASDIETPSPMETHSPDDGEDIRANTFSSDRERISANTFSSDRERKELRAEKVQITCELSQSCLQRTHDVLAINGLRYAPFELGSFMFDSMLNKNPVMVWKHTDSKLPNGMLCELLTIAKHCGYQHLFIIINPGLLDEEFPANCSFTTKYTALPTFYSDIIDKKELDDAALPH